MPGDSEHDLLEHEVDSDSFLEKLLQKDITISWELPELHTLTKQVIKLPDKNVKETIAKLELPWKTGRFSPDEDKIILKYWNKLCKKFDLPNDPKLFASWRNKNNDTKYAKARRFIILWLSQKLTNRIPAQVFHRFLHTLGASKKGRFSETEMEIVDSFLSEKNKAYTQQYLGSILNRDESSIWRKLALLKKKKLVQEKSKKIVWDMKMHEKLYSSIIKVIKENGEKVNLEDLRQRPISWDEWVLIGEKMAIPPLSAKTQWSQKLYVQLFASEKIFKNRIILILIKKFKKKGYKHWVDVDWKRAAKKFPGCTPIFLWKIYYHFALKKCPSLIKVFHKTEDYLYERYVTKNEKMKNRLLKRLIPNGKKKLMFNPEDDTMS